LKLLRFLGYLWALPNCVFALLFGPFYGIDWKSIRWKDGSLHITCKRAIGAPSAQTLGWIMFFVGEKNRAREVGVLGLHESEHVEQALLWGIFRDIAYGAEWVFRFIFMPGSVPASWKKQARWFRAYWNLYWEREARRAAGQRVYAEED
jgi:hypothetical protein